MYSLLENGRSNIVPTICYKEKYFTDFHYDIKEEIKKDIDDNEYTCFTYKTIRVRDEIPTKDKMIQFLIHTEYSLDDEIALINNRGAEYDAYISRRNELKELAKTLYEHY